MPLATAIAITGLALSAASTAGSFIQAGNQRELEAEAKSAAEKAMEEARKRLDVNYYKQLAINKEPYQLERDAILASGGQAIQAGQESDRGAAVTAGRVQMAVQEGAGNIRTAMGNDQKALDLQVAQESSRQNDVNVQLNLAEATGAQMAAANASDASQRATMQGLHGLTNMAKQGESFVPLYEKGSSGRIAEKLQSQYTKLQQTNQLPPELIGVPFQKALEMYGGSNFTGVGAMDPNVFKDHLAGMSPQILRGIDFKNFAPIGPNMPQGYNSIPASVGGNGQYGDMFSPNNYNPLERNF